MARAEDIAARQHTLITYTQARASGLDDDQIDWRLHVGRWILVVRGLYRVAGAPVTPLQLALAPCLAGPPATLASHLTSLALRDLWTPSPLPHVTVGPTQSARLPIARVHRSLVLPEDRTSVRGIPCTTVARAIVESAALLGRDAIARVVDTAFDRRLTSPDRVDAARIRSGARRGIRGLDRAMEPWSNTIRPDSPAEARLLRTLKSWGYPEPDRQVPIYDDDGVLVAVADVAWRRRFVGIEYDSTRWHNPRRWEHDEARHEAVECCGYRLLHADKADLMPGERSLRDQLAAVWAA